MIYLDMDIYEFQWISMNFMYWRANNNHSVGNLSDQSLVGHTLCNFLKSGHSKRSQCLACTKGASSVLAADAIADAASAALPVASDSAAASARAAAL